MKIEFARLKRNILIKVILSALLLLISMALISMLLIEGAVTGPIADKIPFLNNRYLWITIGYILLLLIFYLELSKLIHLFLEVGEGMELLTKDTEKDIILSPEIKIMEKKLNEIKNIQKKRVHDAKEANQRKNELIVSLAHDIKSPLTSIIGYLNLLDEAYDMPEEQKMKYIRIALDKSYRLEQLMNEFFDITRNHLQSILFNKQTINLANILNQTAEEFYPVLTLAGLVAVVKADAFLSLNGDADKLSRSFGNILSYMAAYSNANYPIEITAIRVEKDLHINFISYGRTPSPSNHCDLGLVIANNIIVAHGGTLSMAMSDDNMSLQVRLPIDE